MSLSFILINISVKNRDPTNYLKLGSCKKQKLAFIVITTEYTLDRRSAVFGGNTKQLSMNFIYQQH